MEESNTASILLCLGTKPGETDSNSTGIPTNESSEDLRSKLQVSRGNIIDQLRQRVRVEAAQNVKDVKGDDYTLQEDEDILLDDKDLSDHADFDDEGKNLESFSSSWKGGQELHSAGLDPNKSGALTSDDMK